ncbi:MAG: zinc ribbon domain-containing protein [Gammaproteobacteria bacterium]|nr:zinc ribbon domain-containing protein [Gammaproteobacteria bacterium]
MALIQCKECKKEVSDKAMKCPGCGATLKLPKRGALGQIFLWLFILFNGLMIYWLMSYWGDIGNMDSQYAAGSLGDTATGAGAAIGTSLLIFLWAAGDLILGLFVLFTRPKN